MSATHHETGLTLEPSRVAGAQPCRFCGEAHKLNIEVGGIEVLWAINADGAVVRDASGQPADAAYDDWVNCQVCDASAPLTIWNATPEWMRKRCESIAAADAEYDDDGRWMGRRQ
jgi:hypothetical protein